MPTLNKKEIEAEFDKQFSYIDDAYMTDSFYGGNTIAGTTEKIKSFIHSTRQQDLNETIEWVEGLKENWKPTEGYGSEEEKGFQKGIMAQIKLTNKKVDEVVAHLTNLKEKI